MRFLGFDLTLGRECPDCARKERQLEGLRNQNRLMGENGVELLDEIHRLRAEKAEWLEKTRAHAKAMAELADLRTIK